MTRHVPFSTAGVVAAIVFATAACGSGGPAEPTASPLDSPTPVASPSASPSASTTPTASASPSPTASATPTATGTETEDGKVVLAGQFTAFVGADGAGPACDAYVSEAWWATKPSGPYVGLSDNRAVTAAGREEVVCLLGFDGQVTLTVTTPAGEEQVIAVDATRGDGGVDALEVAAGTSPATAMVLAAWQQSSPGVTVTSTPSPTDGPSTPEPSDGPKTPEPSDDPTGSPDDAADPVELTWQVPEDARGDYTFVARQGDLAASAVVRVVAPTRLEVEPEADGVRLVTLHDWPGEPVPVGLYRKQEATDLVTADGYRGKPFELVAELGTIADGESVAVTVGELEFGHWCVISPAVTFVDCRTEEQGSSGWSQ